MLFSILFIVVSPALRTEHLELCACNIVIINKHLLKKGRKEGRNDRRKGERVVGRVSWPEGRTAVVKGGRKDHPMRALVLRSELLLSL